MRGRASTRSAGRPAERRLGPRHVRVAGADRATLRGEARAGEPDERERRSALALGRRVAAPDVREAVEVEGGDERVAEAPDRSAAGALDVVLDRDAVVTADRLREHAVVGYGVRSPKEGPALARGDRAGDLAAAGARLCVLGDRGLDGADELGAGGQAVLVAGVRGWLEVRGGTAVRRLEAGEADALGREHARVGGALLRVAVGLRVQHDRDDRDQRHERDRAGAAE